MSEPTDVVALGTAREIDTGSAPMRFARGWHCLGLAETFRNAKPHAVDIFGTKLVVFADADGALTWNTMLIEGSNCREIIDNNVDMAHFFYVHFAYPTYFKNVFEKHTATQYLRSRGRPDVRLGANPGDRAENLVAQGIEGETAS